MFILLDSQVKADVISAVMVHGLFFISIASILFPSYTLVYERPNLSVDIEGVGTCTVGRLNYSSRNPEEGLTVRALTNYSSSISVCQVTFVQPFDYVTCAKPLRDILLRVSYIPTSFGDTLRPWCVAGKISTRCYCAGENCFRDTWSVFVFLLEVYREGFSEEMEGQSKKLAKSYGKLKERDEVNTGSGHSVASTLYCILREMKKEFKLDVVPAILIPDDAAIEKDWESFDERLRGRIQGLSPEKGKKDEDSKTLIATQDKEKRMKERFDIVLVIMVALNAICLAILAAFFCWYMTFSKREMQSLGITRTRGPRKASAEDIAGKKKSSEEDPAKKKSAEALSAGNLSGEQAQGPPPSGAPRKPLPGVDPYFW
ncbi:hypothetical protein V3C99_012508 [Haemonchus contortus]